MSIKKFFKTTLQKSNDFPINHYKLYFSGLTAFGIVLIISGFTYLGYRFYEKTVLSFDSQLDNIQIHQNIPSRITIADRNIDVSVEPTQIINGVWMVSDNSASFPQGSQVPGGGGNIIIYGHNKGSVLGNLKKVQKGDNVAIKMANNEIFLYKVDEILKVTPDRTDVVGKTNEETLTIYTCTGFLDSQRLVIKAKPFKV
jgi:LPXTG-site transpeptidase (sortase) family protein